MYLVDDHLNIWRKKFSQSLSPLMKNFFFSFSSTSTIAIATSLPQLFRLLHLQITASISSKRMRKKKSESHAALCIWSRLNISLFLLWFGLHHPYNHHRSRQFAQRSSVNTRCGNFSNESEFAGDDEMNFFPRDREYWQTMAFGD